MQCHKNNHHFLYWWCSPCLGCIRTDVPHTILARGMSDQITMHLGALLVFRTVHLWSDHPGCISTRYKRAHSLLLHTSAVHSIWSYPTRWHCWEKRKKLWYCFRVSAVVQLWALYQIGCYGNRCWCGALWLDARERALYLDWAEARAQRVNAHCVNKKFDKFSALPKSLRASSVFVVVFAQQAAPTYTSH